MADPIASPPTLTLGARDLLRLVQLASPALPVGAYSYSEGLETLILAGAIPDGATLRHWLGQELQWGAIRQDGAAMAAVMAALAAEPDWATVLEWNQWLSAVREAEEMRHQSWQMGTSLRRLLRDLEPTAVATWPPALRQDPCNFAIVFGLAAAHWQLPMAPTLLVYLESWAANLISAAVRLVPLGQTEGQRVLLQLGPALAIAAATLPTLGRSQLTTCNWGLALAAMNHETLYSRLFRS